MPPFTLNADDQQMNEILSLCLFIDLRAEAIYRHFAALAEAEKQAELSEFWQHMAEDEKSHAEFWERAFALAGQGAVPMLFDDPKRTIRELQETRDKVELLMAQAEGRPSLGHQFIMAYRLEFYLLHPAFETLFHFIATALAEAHPEQEYEEHIRRFLKMFALYGDTTPELELLGEVLVRLWERNQILARQSQRDPLTDLLNRRGFFNSVVPLLHHAKRRQLSIGVLLLDVDNFKQINDSSGHLRGDQVLAEVARRIKSQTRASDLTARYGGEEFIVFCLDLGEDHLQAVAEKIRRTVSATPIDGQTVTLSGGASCTRLGDNLEVDFQNLIHGADNCLYEAKQLGKNRTVLKRSGQSE